MPCENCTKRGDALQCTYAQTGSKKKNQGSPNGMSSPSDMQNRIDRLEGLVLSLMTNGSQSAGPAAATAALSASESTASFENAMDREEDMLEDEQDIESETDQVTKSLGVMKVHDQRTMYFGEAHWAVILQDVSYLQVDIKRVPCLTKA